MLQSVITAFLDLEYPLMEAFDRVKEHLNVLVKHEDLVSEQRDAEAPLQGRPPEVVSALVTL